MRRQIIPIHAASGLRHVAVFTVPQVPLLVPPCEGGSVEKAGQQQTQVSPIAAHTTSHRFTLSAHTADLKELGLPAPEGSHDWEALQEAVNSTCAFFTSPSAKVGQQGVGPEPTAVFLPKSCTFAPFRGALLRSRSPVCSLSCNGAGDLEEVGAEPHHDVPGGLAVLVGGGARLPPAAPTGIWHPGEQYAKLMLIYRSPRKRSCNSLGLEF